MSLFHRGGVKQWRRPPDMPLEAGKTYHVELETTHGNIRLKLLHNEAPRTAANFVFLATEGFFDGVKFHRIVKGFMIQSGDPTGTGAGGPGYQFADEPVRRGYDRGIVAMANAGRNTNGSQFFIMHQPMKLPPNYTIFGEVVDGIDAVDAIAATPVERNRSGECSAPKDDVTIHSATVEVSDAEPAAADVGA